MRNKLRVICSQRERYIVGASIARPSHRRAGEAYLFNFNNFILQNYAPIQIVLYTLDTVLHLWYNEYVTEHPV